MGARGILSNDNSKWHYPGPSVVLFLPLLLPFYASTIICLWFSIALCFWWIHSKILLLTSFHGCYYSHSTVAATTSITDHKKLLPSVLITSAWKSPIFKKGQLREGWPWTEVISEHHKRVYLSKLSILVKCPWEGGQGAKSIEIFYDQYSQKNF